MKPFHPKNSLSIFLIVFSIPLLFGQGAGQEIGKFREATSCPFPLPENLIPGENFKFGYVSVPEFHSRPQGKTLPDVYREKQG